MVDIITELNSEYPLSGQQIAFFEENGFIKLKQVFSPDFIEYFGKIVTEKVIELNTLHLPMEERNTYQKAFLQVPNLWTKSDIIKELVFSKRLAKIAADLLKIDGVRLYHDQALYKEPSGGITPWHADQSYWPLSSDRSITVWMPLQETPVELGALAFAPKSQHVDLGRGLPIDDQSEQQIQQTFEEQNFDYVATAYDIGEVSYHLGWTFHRAGPNTSNRPRSVMTIIYMDEQMRLSEPSNPNQENDRERWCPDVEIGEIINSPLNPTLYMKNGA